MTNIVELIAEGKYDSANRIIKEGLGEKVLSALNNVRKRLAAKKYTEKPTMSSMSGEKLDITKPFKIKPKTKPFKIKPKMASEETEVDELHEARVAIVRARIRGGKVQRRKKVSLVPGMTMRGGKLTRMSPAERRKRKMGARRGKIKARAKRAQSLRKRKLSLMKRSRLGI
jgi:hypothetical protein